MMLHLHMHEYKGPIIIKKFDIQIIVGAAIKFSCKIACIKEACYYNVFKLFNCWSSACCIKMHSSFAIRTEILF